MPASNESGFRWRFSSAAFAAVFLAQGMAAGTPQGKDWLTPGEIEQALAAGNSRLADPDVLAKVKKQEYSFLKKHLRSSNGDVKVALVALLQHINQPFCQDYYLELIRDSLYTVRLQSARGLYLLGRRTSLKVVLGEIHRLDNVRGEEDRSGMLSFLVLAAGSFPGRKTLDTLTALVQREKHPTARAAYQKVLAKLGHQPSRDEIEAELHSSNPLTAKLAMDKVEYLGDAAWADKVKPLLMDERLPYASAFAGRRTQLRVCDYAVTVLGNIDSKKRIPFPVRAGTRYSAEQMAQARVMYGLPEKNEELAKENSAGKMDSLLIGGAVKGVGE